MSEKHDSNHAHPVPLKALVGVWAALVFLTWTTVSVAKLDLGSANIFAAMAIAAVKSVLVALIFMHLLWDKAVNRLIFVSALLFVFLFISFALLDTRHYHSSLIPAYAPEITGVDPLLPAASAGGMADGAGLTGIARGEFLFTTVCVTCHGPNAEGKKELHAPALHHQSPWYIEAQLKKFREGLRGTDPADSTGLQMRPMAVGLPDDQAVKDVAEYISSLDAPLPPVTVKGDVKAGQAYFTTVCIACHGADGRGNATLQSPSVAGQHDWYLLAQLGKFRSGLRGADTKDVTGGQMRAMASTIPSEEMVTNLVAYIATLGR